VGQSARSPARTGNQSGSGITPGHESVLDREAAERGLMARELIALINSTRVGRLREENNLWAFEYEPQWIASDLAFDLSPHLPRSEGRIVDGTSIRPVQWFFDNLLPEEKTRDVLAREAKVDGSDAFGMLAYYGRESAGAITLQPQEEPESRSGHVLL